jgi:protease I
MKNLENKKIAMIIAFKDFRDEEYLITKEILQDRAAIISTVSTENGRAVGSFGATANVDILIKNLDVKNFEIVLFIGGEGMVKHIDDANFHRVVRDIARARKILGAICVAPCVLAKAGVLANKRATVWHSEINKTTIKILQDNGAIFIDEPVVVDGNIITANGPEAAKEFAERLTEMLG